MASERIDQPAWVIEQCLDCSRFNCCGDEDLLPIRCPQCGHLSVLCYECDTYYPDLNNLKTQIGVTTGWNDSLICHHKFPDNLFRNPKSRPSFDEWSAAGLDALLDLPTLDDFREMMIRSAELYAEDLSQGRRSIGKLRIFGYRNLTESLIGGFPGATTMRQKGYRAAESKPLSVTITWCRNLSDPIDRVYALLGITDQLFTEHDE